MKFKEGGFPAAINLKSQGLVMYVKHPGYKITLTSLVGKVRLHIITPYKYNFQRKALVLFLKSTILSKRDGRMDGKRREKTGIKKERDKNVGQGET